MKNKERKEMRKQIKKNETKLMSMGMSGMAYCNEWNRIAKENNELKTKLAKLEEKNG